MSTRPDELLLALLHDATTRAVRTVDAMGDREWRVPSLLPGWTRAHVVAHLALNAEGLAGALAGVREGRSVPMYASSQQRDADIDELAAGPVGELRDRFLAGTTIFLDALAAVPTTGWDGEIERAPGERRFAVVAVPSMRLHEVEIHHADLGLAFSPADWPPTFVELMLDRALERTGDEVSFTARATDLDRTWHHGGPGGPTVSGPGWALGWWLSGRGTGQELTSEGGELPPIEGW